MWHPHSESRQESRDRGRKSSGDLTRDAPRSGIFGRNGTGRRWMGSSMVGVALWVGVTGSIQGGFVRLRRRHHGVNEYPVYPSGSSFSGYAVEPRVTPPGELTCPLKGFRLFIVWQSERQSRLPYESGSSRLLITFFLRRNIASCP